VGQTGQKCKRGNRFSPGTAILNPPLVLPSPSILQKNEFLGGICPSFAHANINLVPGQADGW